MDNQKPIPVSEEYIHRKVDSKFYSSSTEINLPPEKFLTKEEFKNNEQGIVGWNIHRDELIFRCGERIKVNR